MSVYLLHFNPSFKHAAHYVGWCQDDQPDRRLKEHLAGRGSRLVKAAVAAGCEIEVAHFFPGASRTFERRVKNRGSAKKWCPVCGIKERPIPVCEDAIAA
jgi:predicted GIY-YIG superfamily endonuclease